MTLCDLCHENVAEACSLQWPGHATSVFHLCGKCAELKGFPSIPVAEVLVAFPQGLVNGTEGGTTHTPGGEVCPQCATSLHDFRSSGRVGCSSCWRVFETALAEVLRRLHGDDRHVGPEYVWEDGGAVADQGRQRQYERVYLLGELRSAVEREDYEAAAAIRDRISSGGAGQ